MNLFLNNILKFLFTCLTILFLGMWIPQFTNPQSLHFSLIDKHKNLRETKTPRIILIGGSNLSFGINSYSIQKEFKKNVINTSIHGGLGIKYIIEDIIPYLNDSDILIVSPEYSQFYGDRMYGSEPMVSNILANPNNFSLLNLQNSREIISEIPVQAVKNIIKFVLSEVQIYRGVRDNGVYNRSSFNALGDVDAHYDKPKEKFNKLVGLPQKFNDESIKLLMKLKNEIDNKNGHLFFAPPCLISDSYLKSSNQIDKVINEIESNNITILGNSKKYSFNDSLYFNTHYHLTKEGVDLRTKYIISDLSKELSKELLKLNK